MKAENVNTTIDDVLSKADLKNSKPPKLLSDNSSCYFAHDLASYLDKKGMEHSRVRPLHPQTQGKIERYQRSMKNVIKLDNYFSPGQLEAKLEEFVQFYNYQRYHESINNLVPTDMYYGRAQRKLKQRELIKLKTLNARKIISKFNIKIDPTLPY